MCVRLPCLLTKYAENRIHIFFRHHCISYYYCNCAASEVLRCGLDRLPVVHSGISNGDDFLWKTTMAKDFLRLSHITKEFTGVQALKGVDLTVYPGEIHCLAGENGCGKSTLIKIVSGVKKPTSGKIFFEGTEVKNLTPIDAIHKGVQVIYQDFAVFPNLTVAENIVMNRNLMENRKFINWKDSRELALKAMGMIGADMDTDIPVERLSISNKQMVAICRAIINDAKLLILDEPTTALNECEVKMLYDVLRYLKNDGMAIVIVNHKLEEIYEIADTLTILRNGENVASGSINDFDRSRFIECMTGRKLVDKKYDPPETDDDVICDVQNLCRKGSFENVSFTLQKGDVLGITGLLGSGRGEIGDTLFGIIPPTSGTIKLRGKELKIRSISDAVANKIAYVPEDRLTQGLFLSRSIRDNTVAASISDYMVHGRLDLQKMDQVTADWIKKIGCVASAVETPIKTLSGGNAQKMVIAKWLNTHPDLIILNGPTVGVDVGAKADIHAILHDLAAQGMGVIIITDDLSELYYNCNKLIIMKNGKSSGVFNVTDIRESDISAMMSSVTEEEKNEYAQR